MDAKLVIFCFSVIDGVLTYTGYSENLETPGYKIDESFPVPEAWWEFGKYNYNIINDKVRITLKS